MLYKFKVKKKNFLSIDLFLTFRASLNPRSNSSVMSPSSALQFTGQQKKTRHVSASDSRSESFLMSDSRNAKTSNASLRSLPRTEEAAYEINYEIVGKQERKPNEKAFRASIETDYVQLEVC